MTKKNFQTPPKYLLRFFRWFCDPDYVEDIEGDLLERFEKRPSRWRFTLEVFKLLRPGIIRRIEGTEKLNCYGMLKHNLLITLRGFFHHKTTFAINLLGLVASLTCVLFITLWTHDELKKDRFHEDSNLLFQVHTKFNMPDKVQVWRGVPGPLKKEIEAKIPQVTNTAIFTDTHEYTLSLADNGIKANGKFADPEFLDVFNYPLYKGDKKALLDPSSILLTRSLAKRLFGSEDPIGEILTYHFWDKKVKVKVAGILEDTPNESSDNFEFIMPWDLYHDQLITYKGWGNYYARIVVKLNDNTNKQLIEQTIDNIFKANQKYDQANLFLANYADLYLYNDYENGAQSGGRIDYVNLIAVIALFILLIACINFINLSTANASLKAKEIGVKKSFGAPKSALAFQFSLESVMISFFSTAIALFLVWLLEAPFNQFVDKQLALSFNLQTIGFLLVFVLALGVIAGSYPALYLSRLKAIATLKGKIQQKKRQSFGRKALVVVQFSISIIMIVGTLIIGQQMNYVQNKNLGYDRNNLLYFLREGKILENHDPFLAEIEQIPGVEMASASGFTIGMNNRTGGVHWPGKPDDQQVQFWENNGDHQSIEILGLKIIKGRSFNKKLNDEESVIFNQKAIEIMGLKDPIGKTVKHYSGEKKIIGVIKNFTTESLHSPVEPAFFLYAPEKSHNIIVKIEKGNELETIGKIEEQYKAFNPDFPFEPTFIDQDYQAQYKSEMRVAKVFNLFAGLAILISCLGLFGLAVFNIQRKTKEIGIKKVLGCGSWKLAFFMTFDFTKSIFISLAIALPISYVLGIKWLENFAYSISVSWWMLTLAGAVAVVIAWLTVGTQTLRAANADPVRSLKDE